jgi:phospholipid/cholesterol/gamma-HCH transport system permease protein
LPSSPPPPPPEPAIAGASRAPQRDGAVNGFAAMEPAGEDGHHRLRLQGTFTLTNAGETWTRVRAEVAGLVRGQQLDIDMAGVDAIDGATMALLVHVRTQLSAREITAEFTGARDQIQELISLYAGDIDPVPRRRRRPESFLGQVGRSTLEVGHELKSVLGFVGSVTKAFLGILKEPKTGNWRAILPLMERVGSDAIPIVVLINFLVGFVVAYQASEQLSQFGADIFVADLVGKSVTREMGPLMTAIILCGRSGAAFAAEIGTMKVSEEIDALRTMGFGPVRYLVLPRLLALMLATPILTLIADFIGVFGGFVVGAYILELTASAFFHQLREAIVLWDIFSGVIKSVAFAAAIALIACQQGFATTGGAEGVGRRTTASVVTILFALIMLDTAFTVVFEAFDV